MTHDPLGITQSITEEMLRAMNLYVVEQGPIKVVRDGYMVNAAAETRLRLKTADELRAEGRKDMLAKCIEVVEAMHIHGSHPFEGIIECNCVGPRVVANLRALQENNS